VFHEEESIFCEMIISVIVSKPARVNLCLILDGVTEIRLFESPDLTVLDFFFVRGVG